MKKIRSAAYCLCFSIALFSITHAQQNNTTRKGKTGVDVWLTDPDNNILFQQQQPLPLTKGEAAGSTFTINPAQTFQTMDGFGYTLTGGSAMHIYNMDADKRKALLDELFMHNKNNIGVSFLRISIGSSDLDDHVFSYDDLGAGETDEALTKFDLGPDKKWLIPVLKQILAINPSVQILGSPWSPPAWMKTNNSTKGGNLKTEYYGVYANYFVKYIQAMKHEGITINAITIQNEPLNPKNNPSMVMEAEEERDFIKEALGPAFAKAGIKTTIWLYDHNCDRPDYPLTILKDADAAKYIDGSAFHLYGGTIDALTQVHDAYPNKNLYFTEQWVGAPGHLKPDLDWHVKNVIIGSSLNWSKVALEWNLAANSALEPHTPGGCTECLGAITIDGNTVTRNPAYYIIAHAAKFVRPGAVRVGITGVDGLPAAAFKTKEGEIILLVENEGNTAKSFSVKLNDKVFTASLNGGAVATYVIHS
ncbi:MAG TPA: glycoside hydrolase family 30 beta sandwich domain-containing protein [Chitinophagaceae bacterium]|nr:glycoside hydrolase family 30 beta sandwich domain-containing protein [Chitinophagaceae bacterium]